MDPRGDDRSSAARTFGHGPFPGVIFRTLVSTAWSPTHLQLLSTNEKHQNHRAFTKLHKVPFRSTDNTCYSRPNREQHTRLHHSLPAAVHEPRRRTILGGIIHARLLVLYVILIVHTLSVIPSVSLRFFSVKPVFTPRLGELIDFSPGQPGKQLLSELVLYRFPYRQLAGIRTIGALRANLLCAVDLRMP